MKTCCFIGHRKIKNTEELRRLRKKITEELIRKGVRTFLFGSKSRFNDLCHETVTSLKYKSPDLRRGYLRAEYEFIDESYENYLLQFYEFTYFAEKARKAGRAVYLRRNEEMIDNSDYVVLYYDSVAAANRSSGTKRAFEYAVRKGKTIISVCDLLAEKNA